MEEMQPVAEVCQYSAAHMMKGVAATTTVYTATAGDVPCCDACKAFFDRMAAPRPATRSQES